MKLWNKAAGEPWAITAPALNQILEIAAREHQRPEAVAARIGKELQNTMTAEARGNTAIIPVIGPLFRYANLFTQISGASSYEIIAKDFTTALEDPNIHAIILNIDSPGGEVNGCAELAEMIHLARGRKAITAYVSGDAASGAYWIAAACDEIVIASTAALGSIGVVGVFSPKGEDIEIVSSQSPHKRLDPATEDDRARLQARIDALADVFIDAVATYRGIPRQSVLSNFGAGDLLIGKAAVAAGLADRLGHFEALISTPQTKEKTMNEDETEDIKLAERARIEAIMTNAAAQGRTELAHHLAFGTDTSAEQAAQIMSAAPLAKDQSNAFAAAMAQTPNPQIDPTMSDEMEMDEQTQMDAAAQRIANIA